MYPQNWKSQPYKSAHTHTLCVPRTLPHPADGVSRVHTDLDRGSFSCSHCLLHSLHEVLRVAHQHFCRFLILLGA